MSFQKKIHVIRASGAPASTPKDTTSRLGTRPSPLDGRLTTSTGTASLDEIFAGHCGLPTGASLLVQEHGTTDFGGILLRYFIAEGLVQGHHVHVLGSEITWRRVLPGLTEKANSVPKETKSLATNKIKIAWRYEALGRKSSGQEKIAGSLSDNSKEPFCHAFDLAKQLEPSAIRGHIHGFHLDGRRENSIQCLFKEFLENLASRLRNSSSSTIHRIVVPSLLSPPLHSPAACQPQQVLQFIHGLRSLLRQFPKQTTALMTLPISLFPRASGLTRWMELLSDGVIELRPFEGPKNVNASSSQESGFQGLLQIHQIPIFHERGGGLSYFSKNEQKLFKLNSRNGLVLSPFSLPPVIGDQISAENLI